jgi:hypothetical protein
MASITVNRTATSPELARVVRFFAIEGRNPGLELRVVGIGCRIGHGAEKDPTGAATLTSWVVVISAPPDVSDTSSKAP